MKTLAIVNQKGGVGKTTTAVTLGHGLALMGMRVLLVDLDAQGNVADALGVEKGDGLHRLLIGGVGEDAVSETGRPGLYAVLSDKTTVAAKQILAGRNFREYALREALGRLAGRYDVAILDAAPGVDLLQVGALVACTYFLIPVALDHLAVVGASDALASAGSLHQMGARSVGKFVGVLPTMWERQTNESHGQLVELVESYKRMVWPPIPRDTKAREAPAFGQTLWEYASRCRALRGVKVSGGHFGGYELVLNRLMAEVLVREIASSVR